ncbi:MAG TPA: hypothetical protein VEA41_13065 [Salinarimonas sp.]|jgi:hypothetical protein|nr:hypothetical protein [Salinarimonas sp.]
MIKGPRAWAGWALGAILGLWCDAPRAEPATGSGACEGLARAIAAAVGGAARDRFVEHAAGRVIVECSDGRLWRILVHVHEAPVLPAAFLEAVVRAHPEAGPTAGRAPRRCLDGTTPVHRIRGKGGRSHVPDQPTHHWGEARAGRLAVTCEHTAGRRDFRFIVQDARQR